MKENVKNTTKALYTMCICLIVVMGVLFLGNSLTKGTYSAGTVLTKDTKYCSKSGDVVSGSKCCPSGYVVATGGALCCPTGYNKLDSVNLLCSDSKGNTKNAETARTIKTCKAGNILNGNTCTINSASTSCPPGKYYFDQSSQPQNCETCVPGTYCPGGTTSGIPCGSGNYCPEYGLSEPKRCPDDKPLTKTIYSKSINDCYASSSGSGDTSCENKSQGECATKYGASNCVMDSNGCWVKKSTTDTSGKTYACYTRNDTNGTRVWTNNPSSTWTKNNITSANSCKDCYKCIKNGEVSYYLGTISNDNCFFYSHSNTSSSCPGGSTDPIPDPDPEPPTSTPTNPPTSTPSSNVDDNPKTGSIAIFMVWVIAIGTLIYSIAYFKQSKFE